MPTRSILSFHAPYFRAVTHPAASGGLAASSTRFSREARRCGLLSSARKQASAHVGGRDATSPLSAPLEFPVLPAGTSAEENYVLPFEPAVLGEANHDEGSLAAKSACATSVGEDFPALPVAAELARIQQNIVREISAALDSQTPAASDEVSLGPASAAAGDPPAGRDLLSHFGLRQQPFDVTPDPAYLYPNPSHREALAALKRGIEYFRGFMLLVADPGMGKTTLLNRLMEELSHSARVVFLFQTQCTSRELLGYILNELDIDHAGMDAVAMHRALNRALLEEMLRGRRFVLIVDEAQNLDASVLETIRLLSDFETTHSKLIQIVLAGQPQIADTLMKPSLLQLRQRIGVLASLKALSAAEVAEYVDHRLRVSGWSGAAPIFTSDAVAQLAEASAGVPRRINNFCFSALLEAYERGVNSVDAEIVRDVAARMDLSSILTMALPPAASLVDPQIGPQAEEPVAPPAETKIKNETILTGTLTEKVRSHGWSKRPEYRLLVTLERDPMTGVAVADRYYCASLYVDEAQAATLQTGKPIQIRIEQRQAV